MTNVRTIAKNTTSLFIANILSYLFGFFATMYTARYLGVDEFGILSLALSITSIFGVFTDLGLYNLTVREVARDKSLSNKYIGNTAVMKVFLAFLAFGLIFITVNLLGYSNEIKTVVYILMLSVICTSFSNIFNSIFQAYETMEYISIATVLNGATMLLGVLIGLYFHLNLFYFALIYLVSSLIIIIYSLIIFSWKFFLPSMGIDWGFWKPSIKEGIYFGLSSIFTLIYFYIASIILSVIDGNAAVGIYNSAYRLLLVLLFIPSVFTTSVFPVMSQHFNSAKEFLKIEYEKSFKYLLLTAVFILVYGYIFADKIIIFIYGTNYSSAIIALQVLIYAVPFIFITTFLGTFLGAVNKQRIVTIVSILNAILNVSLNFLLIAYFSYVGACAATVVTEALGFVLMFTYISKYFFKISIKENILKTFLSGFLLLSIVYYLKLQLGWAISGFVGVLVYMLLLIILKVIKNEDIEILRKIINNQ